MYEVIMIGGGILSSVYAHRFVDYSLISTPEFYSSSFFWKIYYLYSYTLFKRLRFISAWGFTHISILLCGLREYDNNKLGNALRNFNFIKQESATSIRTKINNWNLGIAKWLRCSFYDPFLNVFKLSKNTSTLLTFIASAFWHGFYPSYYISFFFWQLLLKTERSIYKLRNDIGKYFPTIILNVILVYQFNTIGVVFSALQWENTVKIFYNLRYWHLQVLVFWLIMGRVEKKILKQKKK